MKKNISNAPLNEDKILKNKNLHYENIRTTNINILLNRVRLDEKKNFNKKLILSASLVFLISLIVIGLLTKINLIYYLGLILIGYHLHYIQIHI